MRACSSKIPGTTEAIPLPGDNHQSTELQLPHHSVRPRRQQQADPASTWATRRIAPGFCVTQPMAPAPNAHSAPRFDMAVDHSPDLLRRRSLFIQQADAVSLLGQHHNPSLLSRTEDHRVSGSASSAITDGEGLDAPLLHLDPARQ